MMVRWMRWHCPPDTGFKIRAPAVWGRAHYLSVTEVPHDVLNSHNIAKLEPHWTSVFCFSNWRRVIMITHAELFPAENFTLIYRWGFCRQLPKKTPQPICHRKDVLAEADPANRIVDTRLSLCRVSVADGGPSLIQHWGWALTTETVRHIA